MNHLARDMGVIDLRIPRSLLGTLRVGITKLNFDS